MKQILSTQIFQINKYLTSICRISIRLSQRSELEIKIIGFFTATRKKFNNNNNNNEVVNTSYLQIRTLGAAPQHRTEQLKSLCSE